MSKIDSRQGSNWNRRSQQEKAKAIIRSNNHSAVGHLSELLVEHFGRRNAHLATFFFDGEMVPESRTAVLMFVRKYLRGIRAEFRKHGKSLNFIYTIHGEQSNGNEASFAVNDDEWESAPWRESQKWALLSKPGGSKQIIHKPSAFYIHAVFQLEPGDTEILFAFWLYGSMRINPIPTGAQDLRRLAEFFMMEKWAEVVPASQRAYVPSLSISGRTRKE